MIDLLKLMFCGREEETPRVDVMDLLLEARAEVEAFGEEVEQWKRAANRS